MATIYIYVLLDPRNGEVRYVGKTNNPKHREYIHRSPSALQKGLRRRLWVEELRALGLTPKLEVVEECTEKNWQERERFWIARYGGIRNILNARLGGETQAPTSKERYAAISEKRRGKKRSLETIERLREAWRTLRKDYEPSQEMRDKLREATRIQFADPESRRKHHKATIEWWAGLINEEKQRIIEQGRRGLAKSRTSEHQSKASRSHWDGMTPEERERFVKRRSKRVKEVNKNPEVVARRTIALQAAWNDPVKRAARMEKIRKTVEARNKLKE